MKKPTKNSAGRFAADKRRAAVAELRNKGLSIREIMRALPEVRSEMFPNGLVNPTSGKPWSLAVIHSDLKDLLGIWQTHALKHTGEHQALLIAELQQVKKTAWGLNDLDKVLRAIQQEREILGVDAAKKADPNAIIPPAINVIFVNPPPAPKEVESEPLTLEHQPEQQQTKH